VAVPWDHPLADADGIELKQIKNENLLMSPRRNSPEAYDAIIAACVDAGFSAKAIAVEQSSFIDQVGLVAAGLGVALLPRRLNGVSIRGVNLVPLVGSELESHFYICWHSSVSNPARDLFAAFAERGLASR